MPASSPDASFTLEDLLGEENNVEISSMPSKFAETNDHFSANGSPAETYAVRLKELLLDDDNSDAGNLHESVRGVGDDDEEEDFVYDGDDAPQPLNYEAKVANILGADSSSGVLETASDNSSRDTSYRLVELGGQFDSPRLHVCLLRARIG